MDGRERGMSSGSSVRTGPGARAAEPFDLNPELGCARRAAPLPPLCDQPYHQARLSSFPNLTAKSDSDLFLSRPIDRLDSHDRQTSASSSPLIRTLITFRDHAQLDGMNRTDVEIAHHVPSRAVRRICHTGVSAQIFPGRERQDRSTTRQRAGWRERASIEKRGSR